MPINTNVVTTGQVVGKTGTVSFRPYVGSKVPPRVPPRSTMGGKSVPAHVTSQTSQNVNSNNGKRASVGGKRLSGVNSIVKRKVNRSKQAFRRLKMAQKEVCLINTKAGILRLVKKCAIALNAPPDIRYSAGFIEDVRVLADHILVNRYDKMSIAAIHAGRVTVKANDLNVVGYMLDDVNSRAVKKVAI